MAYRRGRWRSLELSVGCDAESGGGKGAALGCGPSEKDARSYLESQGYTVTEVQKDDGIFKYTATKGQDVCRGNVTIKRCCARSYFQRIGPRASTPP